MSKILSSRLCSKCFVTLVYLSALPLQAATIPRWVHGSWVNVRQASEANSPVLTQVTANTEVHLLSQSDKACEIGWGENQRGFVPCRLLGEKPLTLAEVGNPSPPGGKDNPQYSPPRAFWVAPSAAALLKAGQYFRDTLLPEKQRKLEDGECCDIGEKEPRLVRYAIPEFEAMKALLVKGIVASPDLDPPLLSCQKMRGVLAPLREKHPGYEPGAWDYPGKENFPFAWPLVNDCQILGSPKLHLPAIRPSYFKNVRELLPGSAGIERISAHFGMIERGRVTGGPKWYFERHGNWHYSGAWDIGTYEVKLDKPIVEHVIGRTGLVGAYQWIPQETFKPNGDGGNCAEGLSHRRQGKTLLPGYPAVKDALLWFQTPAALPLQNAKITSRSEKIPVGAAKSDVTDRVSVYEVDLDHDGIADFVVWHMPSPMSIDIYVYININGEWYPFHADSDSECT